MDEIVGPRVGRHALAPAVNVVVRSRNLNRQARWWTWTSSWAMSAVHSLHRSSPTKRSNPPRIQLLWIQPCTDPPAWRRSPFADDPVVNHREREREKERKRVVLTGDERGGGGRWSGHSTVRDHQEERNTRRSGHSAVRRVLAPGSPGGEDTAFALRGESESRGESCGGGYDWREEP
jgi:hypothetical protein